MPEKTPFPLLMPHKAPPPFLLDTNLAQISFAKAPPRRRSPHHLVHLVPVLRNLAPGRDNLDLK